MMQVVVNKPTKLKYETANISFIAALSKSGNYYVF